MTTDVSSEQLVSTEEPVYITGLSHLENIIDTGEVILVDFFATWCGPCQMLEPVLQELAAGTDAVIAKVDVDQHQQLARAFAVRGVPTLLVFADGEQVEQHVGALPADRLRSVLEKYTHQ